MKYLALLAAVLCGCSFDRNGVAPIDGGGGVPDAPSADAGPDASTIDAGPPDATPCVPACTDPTHLDTCAVGQPPTECLLGCQVVDAAGDHCRVLDPSNGISVDQLNGVTAALVVPPDTVFVASTDSGEIRHGATIVRAAGPNVVSGIGFYIVGGEGIFAVKSLEVGNKGTLVGVGGNALGLLSAGDVVVHGIIDVSAGCRDANGAATDDVSCGGPGGGDGATSQPSIASGCAPGADGASNTGPGPETGGGGGGFQDNGAPGGNATPTAGGAGGVTGPSCSPEALAPMKGGSGGGQGGGEMALFGGQGGGGGGGVQISSLTQITIEKDSGDVGMILAAGGGGAGGGASFGGGGGGSGGAILIEAPRVVVSGAVVAANGGGGGQGNGVVAGQNGTASKDAAKGGGGTADGHGGNGGALSSPMGKPSPGFGNLIGSFDGTGGGGGAVGRIRINAVDAPTTGTFVISPAASSAVPASN
jgi:hypothetical protein